MTLRSSLPNFLDLLLACVDSGLGLQSSIGHITEELKYASPELASEFSVCLQQIELGTSLEDAMGDLAERTGLDELRSLKTFIQQTHKFGSSMAGASARTRRYAPLSARDSRRRVSSEGSCENHDSNVAVYFPSRVCCVGWSRRNSNSTKHVGNANTWHKSFKRASSGPSNVKK